MKARQVHGLSELPGPTFSFFWALRRWRQCTSYTQLFSSHPRRRYAYQTVCFSSTHAAPDGFADGVSLRGRVLGELIEYGIRSADEFNVIGAHLPNIPHRYIIVQLLRQAGDIWRQGRKKLTQEKKSPFDAYTLSPIVYLYQQII